MVAAQSLPSTTDLSDRHQAFPSQPNAIAPTIIEAIPATTGQFTNSKWQKARISTYLARCQASPAAATPFRFMLNAVNQARQPSQPTVASDSNVIAAAPAANPPTTRQRRPTTSISRGSATSVGLNRHSARTKPAPAPEMMRRSFLRHQKNSTQMKKTTTDTWPPIQVSNRNGVTVSASRKPVLESSALKRKVRNRSASAAL